MGCCNPNGMPGQPGMLGQPGAPGAAPLVEPSKASSFVQVCFADLSLLCLILFHPPLGSGPAVKWKALT